MKSGNRKGWGAVWEVTDRGEWRVTEAGLAVARGSLSVFGGGVFF